MAYRGAAGAFLLTDAVTVIVPTRDRADILGVTLRSILAQRGMAFSVIVVDEASQDATPALLDALARDGAPLAVVRHEQPRGLPAARNVGLALATTPWVAFCDDDDVWAPDKLQAQQQALVSARADWSFVGAVLVDEHLRLIGHKRHLPTPNLLNDLHRANVVPGGGSGVVARRSLFDEVGGFDETLLSSEDWDLWIRMAERGSAVGVDRPLVAYRVWPGSMSTKVDTMRQSRRTVLANYGVVANRADEYEYEVFLARQLVRSDRRAATAAFARLAIGQQSPRDVIRAAFALLAPQTMWRVGTERARGRIPAEWTAEAERWLSDARRPFAPPRLAEV